MPTFGEMVFIVASTERAINKHLISIILALVRFTVVACLSIIEAALWASL